MSSSKTKKSSSDGKAKRPEAPPDLAPADRQLPSGDGKPDDATEEMSQPTVPPRALLPSDPPILVPVAKIRRSPFQHRTSYPRMAELVESMKTYGFLPEHPVLLRPIDGTDELEQVGGHRRVLAAPEAAIENVWAVVRSMTDEEAIIFGGLDNLQNAHPHPLEEAMVYDQLAHPPAGSGRAARSITEIASAMGQKPRHITERLKLMNLSSKGREAFFAEQITPAVAFLLARIPEHGLQDQALKTIGDSYHPMSTDQVRQLIENQFMRRLSEAPFSTKKKLPRWDGLEAPCTDCPRQTGAQAALFEDVKSKSICLDPACYAGKIDAHWKILSAEASAKGQRVLSEEESKKIFSHDHLVSPAYVDLSKPCYEVAADGDEGYKSWAKTLGGAAKNFQTTVARTPTGRIVELLPKDDAAKALVEAGYASEGAKAAKEAKTSIKSAEKAKLDEADRREQDKVWKLGVALALAELVAEVSATPLTKVRIETWKLLAKKVISIIGSDSVRDLCARRVLHVGEKGKESALMGWMSAQELAANELVNTLAKPSDVFALVVELLCLRGVYYAHDRSRGAFLNSIMDGFDLSMSDSIKRAKAERAAATKGKGATKGKAEAKPKGRVKPAAKAPMGASKAKPAPAAKSVAAPRVTARTVPKKAASKPDPDEDEDEGGEPIERAVFRSPAGSARPSAPSGKCRVCGCTDDEGCASICSWVDEDETLCSVCDAQGREVYELVAKSAPLSPTNIAELLIEEEDDDDPDRTPERFEKVIEELVREGDLESTNDGRLRLPARPEHRRASPLSPLRFAGGPPPPEMVKALGPDDDERLLLARLHAGSHHKILVVGERCGRMGKIIEVNVRPSTPIDGCELDAKAREASHFGGSIHVIGSDLRVIGQTQRYHRVLLLNLPEEQEAALFVEAERMLNIGGRVVAVLTRGGANASAVRGILGQYNGSSEPLGDSPSLFVAEFYKQQVHNSVRRKESAPLLAAAAAPVAVAVAAVSPRDRYTEGDFAVLPASVSAGVYMAMADAVVVHLEALTVDEPGRRRTMLELREAVKKAGVLVEKPFTAFSAVVGRLVDVGALHADGVTYHLGPAKVTTKNVKSAIHGKGRSEADLRRRWAGFEMELGAELERLAKAGKAFKDGSGIWRALERGSSAPA